MSTVLHASRVTPPGLSRAPRFDTSGRAAVAARRLVLVLPYHHSNLNHNPPLQRRAYGFTLPGLQQKTQEETMAQRVVLTDDLDGSEATQTLNYTIDGQEYEIDLSEEN